MAHTAGDVVASADDGDVAAGGDCSAHASVWRVLLLMLAAVKLGAAAVLVAADNKKIKMLRGGEWRARQPRGGGEATRLRSR